MTQANTPEPEQTTSTDLARQTHDAEIVDEQRESYADKIARQHTHIDPYVSR